VGDATSNDLKAIGDLNHGLARGSRDPAPIPIKTEPVDPKDLLKKRAKAIFADAGPTMKRLSEISADIKIIKATILIYYIIIIYIYIVSSNHFAQACGLAFLHCKSP